MILLVAQSIDLQTRSKESQASSAAAAPPRCGSTPAANPTPIPDLKVPVIEP
jgi:hypothetical protein